MEPTTIKKQKHSNIFSSKTLLENIRKLEYFIKYCVFKKNL